MLLVLTQINMSVHKSDKSVWIRSWFKKLAAEIALQMLERAANGLHFTHYSDLFYIINLNKLWQFLFFGTANQLRVCGLKVNPQRSR